MTAAAQSPTLAPDPNSESGAFAVLAVAAGDELYGFPLASVREILVPPPVTEVPRAPEPVVGVISVRGRIITLVDLTTVLNLDTPQADPPGRVLLVDNGSELIGVAVDRVLQVYRIEQDEVEYTSAVDAELSDYVVGLGRVPAASGAKGEHLLILIDPTGLLGEI